MLILKLIISFTQILSDPYKKLINYCLWQNLPYLNISINFMTQTRVLPTSIKLLNRLTRQIGYSQFQWNSQRLNTNGE